MTDSIAPPAPIVYLEIPAPDLERAGNFYRSVFSWEITPSNLTDQPYWMFSAGSERLGGGLDPGLPVAKGGILLYIKVEDIPATLGKIEQAGGFVLRGKVPVGKDMGFSATFEDPNVNRLGLWAGI